MADMFAKWNKEIDGAALARETKEVAENGAGDFKEVPHGEYIVAIEKLELKESRGGKPMVSVWFRIKEDECKGSIIFMNQIIEKPFQLHIMNQFLTSLDSGAVVEFDGDYAHYNNTILDVREMIGQEKLEYKLAYGKTDKGFNTYKIKEVYAP